MVASASEESELDSNSSTPLLQPQLGATAAAAAAALSQLESLQNKLQELEEENQALRTEVGGSLRIWVSIVVFRVKPFNINL